jgi:hypothetical protein
VREQPEVGHAGELLRRDTDQIRIGCGDKAGQRRNPEAGPRRRSRCGAGRPCGRSNSLRRCPPGIAVTTDADAYLPFQQLRLRRFDGTSWIGFDQTLDDG